MPATLAAAVVEGRRLLVVRPVVGGDDDNDGDNHAGRAGTVRGARAGAGEPSEEGVSPPSSPSPAGGDGQRPLAAREPSYANGPVVEEFEEVSKWYLCMYLFCS